MREDSLHFRRRRFDSCEVEAAIPIYRSGIIPPSAVCEWRGKEFALCLQILPPFPKTALRKKVTLSVVPISRIIITKILHLRRGEIRRGSWLYFITLAVFLLLESLFGRSRRREWLSSALSGVM